MTSATHFAQAVDGTRIRYRIEGPAGATTVLLSHSLGVAMDTWDALAADLATTHRVLRYDARGHGGSDAPPGPYDIAVLAQDALAVLDAAGVQQCHFVGLSMGGMVGMWLAAHVPERIARMVLANTTTHIPLRDMWNHRIDTALREGMAEIAPATLLRWLGEAFKASEPAQRDAMIAAMATMSPVGYAGCCAALREVDLRASLGAIHTPTLVLTGSADLATTPAVAEALAAAIPGAHAAVIADAGHLSNVEQPEAFNQQVRDFLVVESAMAS